MGTVWKRLQRAGKRAAKVRFVATLEELLVEGGGSWTPDKLSVVWTRRNRRVSSKPRRWQPGIQNPLRGMVVWVVPESLEVVVTLYRDPQASTFDDKQWKFLVVNESRGHRSVLAGAPLDLGALVVGGDTPLSLSLRPRTRRVTAVTLRLRLRGVVLREGHPTDEDMQSVTSLSPPGDVADLGDFESDPEDEGGALRGGGAPLAPRAPPAQKGDRGSPPTLGAQGDPPEPGGDPETPPQITVLPPGGRGALLAWCQGVTAGYRGVSVTDFGGSWSSGLGFCALLHRLRPQIIDFDALDPRDHRGNNKLAFDAFAALGVPRLLDPSDMERPDSLGVMTFLSQVRAQLGTPPGTPPDPRIGTTEGGPPVTPPDPGTGTMERETPPGPQIGTEGGPQQTPPGPPQLNTGQGGSPSEPQLGDIEGGPPQTPPDPQPSPTPERPPQDPQIDPIDGGAPTEPQIAPIPDGPPPDPQADTGQGGAPQDPQIEPIDEEPPQTDTVEGGPPQPSPDPQLGSSEGEPPRDPQSDPVERELSETPPDPQLSPTPGGGPPDPQIGSVEGGPPQTLPDPQLGSIAGEAPPDPPSASGGPAGPDSPPGGLLHPPPLPRAGGAGGACPTPPPRSRTLSRLRDPPQGRPPKDPSESLQGHPRNPPTGDIGTPPATPPAPPPSDPPTKPPDPGEEEMGGQWVVAELEALEQDQARLDAQAPALERELRELLESGADPPREERLLQDWFALVHQRNLLVRRQDQLQLLAQERDLERRFELLSQELRGLLGTEEWLKAPAQRQREQLLLEELVALVNRRDRLVRDRHRRETRAQEEDEELERSLDPRRRRLTRRETCGIV